MAWATLALVLLGALISLARERLVLESSRCLVGARRAALIGLETKRANLPPQILVVTIDFLLSPWKASHSRVTFMGP